MVVATTPLQFLFFFILVDGAHMLIGVPPNFTKNGEPPANIAVFPNGAILPCGVTGTPDPSVTWYRENRPVDQIDILNDGSLQINQNKLTREGIVFYCVARNVIGRNNYTASLRSSDVNVSIACELYSS